MAASVLVGSGVNPASADPFPKVLKEGGSLTVLLVASQEGTWPQGLDPSTDSNAGSNEDLEDSIYGELFELGPSGNTVDDLATGYKIVNGGKTYQISIRPGVRFSDGTPLNAAAVVKDWKRDFQLKPASLPTWPVASFTTSGPDTAIINLTTPYSPLIDSMHDSAVNWIGSPTALAKMGATRFALQPVGAGPFTVVSDTVSNELVLKKNPIYWQKGLPYLNSLTFKDAATDGTALEDLSSGQAQAYKDLTTPKLVPQAKSSYTVTEENTASPYDVQLNTDTAPFKSILAREAIYYALDVPTLNKKLFGDATSTVQGFTGPGGLFYHPSTPGYRTYNLTKAKALVKQVGGVDFTLLSASTAAAETLAEGMQSMWEAAGMTVKLQFTTTPQVVALFDSNKWQADLSTDGAFDPATGVAQMFRFLSTSHFSGAHDPKLDALLKKATVVPEAQRGAVYQQVAEYESSQALAPELFPIFAWNVTAKNVYVPGLTTVMPATEIVPEPWWQNAGFTS